MRCLEAHQSARIVYSPIGNGRSKGPVTTCIRRRVTPDAGQFRRLRLQFMPISSTLTTPLVDCVSSLNPVIGQFGDAVDQVHAFGRRFGTWLARLAEKKNLTPIRLTRYPEPRGDLLYFLPESSVWGASCIRCLYHNGARSYENSPGCPDWVCRARGWASPKRFCSGGIAGPLTKPPVSGTAQGDPCAPKAAQTQRISTRADAASGVRR